MAQHMEALALANELRIERANIKKQIKAGEITVIDALDDPAVTRSPVFTDRERYRAHGMKLSELLRAQDRWGAEKVRRFLGSLQINYERRVWELTDRQRKDIVRRLEARRTR